MGNFKAVVLNLKNENYRHSNDSRKPHEKALNILIYYYFIKLRLMILRPLMFFFASKEVPLEMKL